MKPSSSELEIRRELTMTAPPARVWEALTKPERLSAWFPDSVELDGARAGARGWFCWEQHGRFAFEILEIDAPKRLVWRWAQDGGRELEQTHTTKIEWDLEPTSSGGTLLRLRESGFAAETFRQQNEEGWRHELGELMLLLKP